MAQMSQSHDADTNYETLTWQVDPDGIALLTLNRPEALNAFSVTMAQELHRVFSVDARDDKVRAVVVTGAGRAFCAGMDLNGQGNVFGLDESLNPTPADLRDRFEDPDIASG
ncbi:MAG TPA: enoyl-CoA hydratase-related protein, partial [Marmoricola sp.]|nr:enoyl-CoA hydratase-related protein [Marmoricola sp.]